MTTTSTGPGVLLRVEGLALLAASVAAYWAMDGGWGTFALFFLMPDLALFGYFAGARVGAATYNLSHTSTFPLLLIVAAVAGPARVAALAGLIWLAHIGFDRVLGFGLKYPSGFKDTHLSRL